MSLDLEEGTITFYRLWDYLKRAGMKKQDLTKILSPTIINKLDKNYLVTTSTIAKICEFLKCRPEDIMEYDPTIKAKAMQEERQEKKDIRARKKAEKEQTAAEAAETEIS